MNDAASKRPDEEVEEWANKLDRALLDWDAAARLVASGGIHSHGFSPATTLRWRATHHPPIEVAGGKLDRVLRDICASFEDSEKERRDRIFDIVAERQGKDRGKLLQLEWWDDAISRTLEAEAAQGEARWRIVLEEVKSSGRHPEEKHLEEIIARFGVPGFAGSYVAGRFSGRIRPGNGRPRSLLPLKDMELLESLGLPNTQPIIRQLALDYLETRHMRYKNFESRRSPRKDNRPRLWYVKSRGVWRVKNPKTEARRQVARRMCISPATLEDWERAAP